jgi:hypothetical protein
MKETISNGITFKGFSSITGFVLFIAGVLLFFGGEQYFLSIFFLIVGIVLAISIRGVIIDLGQGRIKPYLNLLVYKAGSWKPLGNYDKIVLSIFNESQTMNMVSISNTFTVKTFDVYLRGRNTKDLLLKEFPEYPPAKSFLETYSAKLGKEKTDNYEIMLEAIEEKRQQGNS